MLLAVDPTTAVADDALAQVLTCCSPDHPLLLRRCTSVAAQTPKGRVVHRLVRRAPRLYVAHTNADSALGGVNDALADLLGLSDRQPLQPATADGAVPAPASAGSAAARATTLDGLAALVGDRLPATAQGVRSAATPTAWCAPSRSAAAAATACSTPRARPAPTPTSPPTCGTTRPARRASTVRTGGRTWSTSRTGPASGRGSERCADLLREHLADLEVEVSTRRTDPWTFVVAPDRERPRERPRERIHHVTKANALDQVRLLDVQTLDTRLLQLAHRRRTLPEHQQLADVEAERRGLADRLVQVRTTVGDVQRELRKAEADVEQVATRAAATGPGCESGTGSAKDLQGLQHELESLARRQSDSEDVELRGDGAARDRPDRGVRPGVVGGGGRGRAAELVAARDAALDGGRRRGRDRRPPQRDQIAGGLDQDLVALYDKVRDQTQGVGAAMLRGKRCEGCRMELTPVEIARIKGLPDDEVVRCEECRRILVRDHGVRPVSTGYAGDLTPREAWELLGSEPDAVLVDCRTRAEWSYVGGARTRAASGATW